VPLHGLAERGQIDDRIAGGWLIRRHMRVFAVGHVPRTRESRFMAAVLALAPDGVLSCRAAGAQWLILSGAVPAEVTVPTQAGHENRDGIILHRAALPPGHVTERDGIPITTLVRTVLDLAAILTPWELERAFEQAQVIHKLDPLTVAVELECRRGYRGTARLRRLLAGAVDPTAVRSVLELRFLALCQSYGIPRPLVNEQVGPWTPDFFWPEHNLVVETDSEAFHSSIAARRRDPLKDEELAKRGIRVIRLRWRNVVETPAETAATLHTAFAASKVSYSS